MVRRGLGVIRQTGGVDRQDVGGEEDVGIDVAVDALELIEPFLRDTVERHPETANFGEDVRVELAESVGAVGPDQLLPGRAQALTCASPATR